MKHEDNCRICREGIQQLPPDQHVFGILEKETGIYRHAIGSDAVEAVKSLCLTRNLTRSILLPKKKVRELIKRGLEVNKMKTDLETQMAELQKWALFGQKVAELYNGLSDSAPRKKKRVRRTKAQIEAARQEVTATQVEAAVKPKRSHSRKKAAVAQDGAAPATT